MKLVPFSRYKIVGHSMEPTFHEGDVVWVYSWAYIFNKPKVGDLVVLSVGAQEIIKRISGVEKTGFLVVRGDNESDSLDSRKFGEVGFGQVVGKVLTKSKQGH